MAQNLHLHKLECIIFAVDSVQCTFIHFRTFRTITTLRNPQHSQARLSCNWISLFSQEQPNL